MKQQITTEVLSRKFNEALRHATISLQAPVWSALTVKLGSTKQIADVGDNADSELGIAECAVIGITYPRASAEYGSSALVRMTAALKQATSDCVSALRLEGYAAGGCKFGEAARHLPYTRAVTFNVRKFKRAPREYAVPLSLLVAELTAARAAGFEYAMVNIDGLPNGAVAVELRTSNTTFDLASPLNNETLVRAVTSSLGWSVKASYSSKHKTRKLGADVFHLVPNP